MRLVVHGRDETVEYQYFDDRWMGDDGSRVSIEAMVPAGVIEAVGDRGLTLSAGG